MLINYGNGTEPYSQAPDALPRLPDVEDDGSAQLSRLPELDVTPPSLTEAVAPKGMGLQEEEESRTEREEMQRLVFDAAESDANQAFVAELERMVPKSAPNVEMRDPPVENPLDDSQPGQIQVGGVAMPESPPPPPTRIAHETPIPGVSSDHALFSREPNQHFDQSKIRQPSANVQMEFDKLADFRSEYKARLAESLTEEREPGTFSLTSLDGGEASETPSLDNFDALPDTEVLYRGLPGDILFGFLDSDVNSDHLHQVVATIGDGGVLDGAVLVGEPSLLGQKRIIISFSSMHFRGRELPVNAVAVNPITLEVAMADSVNSHVVDRYGSLMLAALMRGYAESLRQETVVHTQAGPVVYSTIGSTTGEGGDEQETSGQLQVLTRSDPSTEDRLITAAGEVAETLIPTLRSRMSRPPTVKVFARSGVGIKLLSPLTVPAR